MAKHTPVDAWKGGRLRVFMQMGPALVRAMDDDAKRPRQLELEFKPAGAGWAIRADAGPVTLELGVELDFDIRAGRLECVAIRSSDDGPPLNASLLRQVGPSIAPEARDFWGRNVVKLGERDGEVVAVLPTVQPGGEFFQFGTIPAEVDEEFSRRRRQPLTDERLAKVAALWLEAVQRREPSAARYVAETLNYAPGTVRNLMRVARDRADEYAAAQEELSPAQHELVKNAARWRDSEKQMNEEEK